MIRFIFLLHLLMPHAYADIVDNTTTSSQEEPPLETHKGDLIVLPVIYYTPETKVALGATLVYSYRSDGQRQDTQKSTFFPALIYTQNRQTVAVAVWRHIYGQDLWRQRLSTFYSIYPINFYGIGDATRKKDIEVYDSRNKRFSFGLGRKIIDSLYLGAQASYRETQITDFEKGGYIDRYKPLGFQGSIEKGLGFYLNYDSADDHFNPQRGVRSELSYMKNAAIYGSDFEFTNLSFFIRHYLQWTTSGQLAFEIVAQDQKGDVPFTSLSELGGPNLMRGVFQGRFRDKALGALQLEWRQKFTEKFGAVLFVTQGHVAPEFKQLSIAGSFSAYGAGVRINVNKKANTVIRIDSGLTKEGYGGSYFSIGQAF